MLKYMRQLGHSSNKPVVQHSGGRDTWIVGNLKPAWSSIFEARTAIVISRQYLDKTKQNKI